MSLNRLDLTFRLWGEEEQVAYDNLPKFIQDSERGESMSDNVSDLEDAADGVDEIISTLQTIIGR